MNFSYLLTLHDRAITKWCLPKPGTPGSMFYPMPAPVEFQLDVMIHRTQITERYPFTVIRSK